MNQARIGGKPRLFVSSTYIQKLIVMRNFAVLMIFVIVSSICHAQNNVTGIVTDINGNGLPGARIKNSSRSELVTKGDATGHFKIQAETGDRLVVELIGFSSRQILITAEKKEYVIVLVELDLSSESVVVTAISSRSLWTGATLFYNLDGSDLDNVVGAGKVLLNTARRATGKFRLNIIGNISKFSSAADTKNPSSDILEISQSSQGLSAGFEPLYMIVNNSSTRNYLNLYSNLMYKLNNFQKINNTEENIALSQGRFTVGLEWEGVEFSDGGNLIHVGIEGTKSIFSASGYEKVFNKNIKSLSSAEVTVIVPLFSNLGLLVNYTMTKGIKPVFGAGIILGTK